MRDGKVETAGIYSAGVNSNPRSIAGIVGLCLLSFFASGAALAAGKFELSAGMSTGAYATRLNSAVVEASWQPTSRWDLAVGYLAGQETPCDACRQSGYVAFQTPDGIEYEYVDQQDADPYWYLSGTRTFNFDLGRGFTAVTGVGLMVASETNVLLSRSVNFSLQAGLQYKRVRFQYRHFSNAGTKLPNLGQNLLLIGYQF